MLWSWLDDLMSVVMSDVVSDLMSDLMSDVGFREGSVWNLAHVSGGKAGG